MTRRWNQAKVMGHEEKLRCGDGEARNQEPTQYLPTWEVPQWFGSPLTGSFPAAKDSSTFSYSLGVPCCHHRQRQVILFYFLAFEFLIQV